MHRDGHIELAQAYYSVPPEYVGRKVWVRWEARLVRIYNLRMEQIALHTRHEPGKFATDAAHIHDHGAQADHVSLQKAGLANGHDHHIGRAR